MKKKEEKNLEDVTNGRDLEESIGVKLSQEVKRMFDAEIERQNLTSDDLGIRFSSSYDFQHNYDAIYYAQEDPWVKIFFFLLFARELQKYVFFIFRCWKSWKIASQ